MTTENNYDFEYLSDLSDEELINRFNQEVGINAWGNSRAAYLHRMHNEFIRRKFDISLISDQKGFSLAKRIKLQNRTIIFE